MFSGIVFFIVIQLLCFYKKGMVFSPWYNYGMYSEVIQPQSNYTVTKVYADGKLLQGNQFSAQHWDKIQFNLQQAAAAKCNEHFYETQIKRLYQKFHLPAPGAAHFINTKYSPEQILANYHQHLAQWLGCSAVKSSQFVYNWDGNEFILKDSLSAIISTSFQCK